jgi:hypothetical protein
MHALTGWHITQRNEVVGMSGSGSTFVLVATYPDEAAARDDAAAGTKDASSMVRENKDETARLVTVGESKLEDAIWRAVTRTEKQMAEEPGVDSEDTGTAWQEPVREM